MASGIKIKQVLAKYPNKFITSDNSGRCESTHDFNANILPFNPADIEMSATTVAGAIDLIWSIIKAASPTADEVITQELVVNSEGVITSTLESLPDDLSDVILIVNGLSYDSFGGDPAFTIDGTTITWNMESNEVEFALDPTDEVVVQFTVKGEKLIPSPFILEGYINENYFNRGDTPTKYTEITPMTANVVEVVIHNLDSEDIIVNVWDLSTNTQINPTIIIVDGDTINVTTTSDYDNIKVVVIK